MINATGKFNCCISMRLGPFPYVLLLRRPRRDWTFSFPTMFLANTQGYWGDLAGKEEGGAVVTEAATVSIKDISSVRTLQIPGQKRTFAQILCMTNDQIEKFLEPEHIAKNVVRINFKTRNTILGIFINSADYQDLKSKNFWRISANCASWKYDKASNVESRSRTSGALVPPQWRAR